MSTHNLCFRAKIRKIGMPLHTPIVKVGFKGVYILWTCFPDDVTVLFISAHKKSIRSMDDFIVRKIIISV